MPVLERFFEATEVARIFCKVGPDCLGDQDGAGDADNGNDDDSEKREYELSEEPKAASEAFSMLVVFFFEKSDSNLVLNDSED